MLTSEDLIEIRKVVREELPMAYKPDNFGNRMASGLCGKCGTYHGEKMPCAENKESYICPKIVIRN